MMRKPHEADSNPHNSLEEALSSVTDARYLNRIFQAYQDEKRNPSIVIDLRDTHHNRLSSTVHLYPTSSNSTEDKESA